MIKFLWQNLLELVPATIYLYSTKNSIWLIVTMVQKSYIFNWHYTTFLWINFLTLALAFKFIFTNFHFWFFPTTKINFHKDRRNEFSSLNFYMITKLVYIFIQKNIILAKIFSYGMPLSLPLTFYMRFL